MRLERQPIAILACIIAGFLLLPVVSLLFNLGTFETSVWRHLLDTVLADYIINSLLLTIGVGTGSALIAVPMAWLLTQYQVPARRWWQWLVLMPLAMPAYIIAYTYTGMLDSSGPLQQMLQSLFDVSVGEYWFPDVRSLGGAIILMSLVLYPYVFVLARSAFSQQSQSLFEASQAMGVSRVNYFFKIALPIARPAIVTGVALTMMEALADYGTVQYFGVSTFTTGIFRTWFGLGSQNVASQLSVLLTTVVLAVLLLEQYSRRHMKFASSDNPQSLMLRPLSPFKKWMAGIFLGTVFLLGFGFPVLQMMSWIISRWDHSTLVNFVPLLRNTMGLALVAAFVVVILAIIISYAKRIGKSHVLSGLSQLALMGYAFPGAVIAVATMMLLTSVDYWINDSVGLDVGLLFSGSLFAVIFAYCVRFLAVAVHNVDTGLGRVTRSMDDAAQSMGVSAIGRLVKVHLPLIKGSVLSAILLVFVDVLKELPATLILRPFDFNTLAIRAFELASDERLQDAALPSFSIVLIGLLPVILLAYQIDKSYQKRGRL